MVSQKRDFVDRKTESIVKCNMDKWEDIRLGIYNLFGTLLLIGIIAIAFHFGGKVVGIITSAVSLFIIVGMVVAWIILAGKRNRKEIEKLRSNRQNGE